MLKAVLILFELDELDVILGMNFLTQYHAVLVLRESRKFEVKFVADKKVELT